MFPSPPINTPRKYPEEKILNKSAKACISYKSETFNFPISSTKDIKMTKETSKYDNKVGVEGMTKISKIALSCPYTIEKEMIQKLQNTVNFTKWKFSLHMVFMLF